MTSILVARGKDKAQGPHTHNQTHKKTSKETHKQRNKQTNIRLLQYFVAYARAWSAPCNGSKGITFTLAGENMVRYKLCGTTNWSSSGKRRCRATLCVFSSKHVCGCSGQGKKNLMLSLGAYLYFYTHGLIKQIWLLQQSRDEV